METKYEELKRLQKENPEKAQKMMINLAEKYIDKDLVKLWGVPHHKVSKLRRQLGVEKNSAGEIQQIFPPNTYTPEEGFTNGRVIEKEIRHDRRKTDKEDNRINLSASGLTKEQLQQMLKVVEFLSKNKAYSVNINIKPLEDRQEKVG